jgi:hypothetical protein
LSQSAVLSNSRTIYPGKVSKYVEFRVDEGLEILRELISSIEPNCGIELIGKIGITSHFGDILKNAQIPSKLSSSNR